MPDIKLLHSMRKPEYLEGALKEGITFRAHKVLFVPTDNVAEYSKLLEAVLPALNQKLLDLGKPLDSLSDVNRTSIFAGLGSISGKLPMICFTEVSPARSLHYHSMAFGQYGLVVRRRWLEENGGVKVSYVGGNSQLTREIYDRIARANIANLVTNSTGEVLFGHKGLKAALEQFVHLEISENASEAEWRIAGQHGFLGGKSATNSRLPIALDDIEFVIVKTEGEVEPFKRLIEELRKIRRANEVPEVICDGGDGANWVEQL